MKNKGYLKKLGANIKKLRKEKGMTQTELGYNCGFEKQNMQRIEAGKTNPTIKTLLLISAALEIDIKDVLVSNLD